MISNEYMMLLFEYFKYEKTTSSGVLQQIQFIQSIQGKFDLWSIKKSHQSSLRLHSFITFVFISLLQNDLVALVYSCFPCCCCCLRSYLPYRNQRFGHMASRYASVSKSSPFNSHRSWAVSFRSNQTGSLSSRRSHLSSSHRQTRASVNSNKSTLKCKKYQDTSKW